MVVSGIRARIVRTGILLNILLLALFSARPGRWTSLLKEIGKKRMTIQGLPPAGKFIKEQGRFFLTENIPGWPSRAFNGFFRNEINRILKPDSKGPLSTIIMAITSKCTLACGHCYEWNNISASEALAVGDIMRIVDKVKGSGVRHIQLSGGEPLERFEDLLKIIKYASRGADVWILTSGYGLTREKAALMRKAGLTGADISLDHWDAREHNRSRNNPRAFAWVREAVRNCNETGLVTALSLCAFKEFVSADNLARYIDCARRWNSGFIRLLEPRRAGKFLDRNVELEEDQFKLLEAFFQETNISPEYSGFPIITFPSWTQRRTGCLGAGNRYLYIDSKGEFHACPFCQRSAGNAVSSGMDEAISLLRKYGCQKYVLNLAD